MFFKLSYIGKYSNSAQKRFKILLELFVKTWMSKLYSLHSRSITSFHIHLQSFIIYKFICANCKVCYAGETTGDFITRINEHLQKDSKCNIFKHLQESRICNSVCSKDCFSVIDWETTENQLKMKKSMHIKCIQLKLNKQVKHYTLSLIG